MQGGGRLYRLQGVWARGGLPGIKMRAEVEAMQAGVPASQPTQ